MQYIDHGTFAPRMGGIEGAKSNLSWSREQVVWQKQREEALALLHDAPISVIEMLNCASRNESGNIAGLLAEIVLGRSPMTRTGGAYSNGGGSE